MRGPPGFGEAAHDARGSLRKRVPSGSSFCLPSRDPHQARQRLRFAPGASAVAFWRERDGPVPVNPACKKVFRASSVFCLRASNRRGEAEPPGKGRFVRRSRLLQGLAGFPNPPFVPFRPFPDGPSETVCVLGWKQGRFHVPSVRRFSFFPCVAELKKTCMEKAAFERPFVLH